MAARRCSRTRWSSGSCWPCPTRASNRRPRRASGRAGAGCASGGSPDDPHRQRTAVARADDHPCRDRPLDRLRAAGRRGRLLGRRRSARARPVAERRRGHRRRADRAAGADQGSDGQGPGRQQEGRERRAVPRLRRTGDQPGRRVRLERLRPGRARAFVRRRAVRAWPAIRSAMRCAKFGADRYDPKDLTLSLSYDLQRAAVAALGKRRGAVVMLDPATGEVLALASTPTYDASAIADPSDGPDDIRGPPGRPDPATPAARHARTVRARIGVQDRDRRRRPRLGCDHAEDHVQGAATGRGERPGRRRLPGARRPPSRDRLQGARSDRGDRGLLQHLLRPDRSRDRWRRPRRLCRADGLRVGDPVRPADGDLAGDQRRRL